MHRDGTHVAAVDSVRKPVKKIRDVVPDRFQRLAVRARQLPHLREPLRRGLVFVVTDKLGEGVHASPAVG